MAIKVTNKMAFWLSFTDAKGSVSRLQFPVNPETFDATREMGYTDVEISRLGEVTVMGNKKLMTVSFSGFFPRDYNHGFCEYTNIPKPYDAVKKIESWMMSKRPVQLTITHTNINIPVTIRSFKYYEKGGEVGDVYFDIEFKEFRAPKVKVYNPNVTKPTPTRPVGSKYGVKYVVKKGDTLSSIAQKFYGDASKWRLIYDTNRSVIGNNPNRIYPGMVLYIPNPDQKPSGGSSSTSGYQWYTIRSGDTLIEIANAYSNCSLNDIYRLNPNIKANSLRVGQKIKLPSDAKRLREPKRLSYSSGGNSGKMQPAPKPAEKTYMVMGVKVSKQQYDKYMEMKRKQLERFDDTSTVSKGSPPKGVLV